MNLSPSIFFLLLLLPLLIHPPPPASPRSFHRLLYLLMRPLSPSPSFPPTRYASFFLPLLLLLILRLPIMLVPLRIIFIGSSVYPSVRLPVITQHLHNRHNSLGPARRAPFPCRYESTGAGGHLISSRIYGLQRGPGGSQLVEEGRAV